MTFCFFFFGWSLWAFLSLSLSLLRRALGALFFVSFFLQVFFSFLVSQGRTARLEGMDLVLICVVGGVDITPVFLDFFCLFLFYK